MWWTHKEISLNVSWHAMFCTLHTHSRVCVYNPTLHTHTHTLLTFSGTENQHFTGFQPDWGGMCELCCAPVCLNALFLPVFASKCGSVPLHPLLVAIQLLKTHVKVKALLTMKQNVLTRASSDKKERGVWAEARVQVVDIQYLTQSGSSACWPTLFCFISLLLSLSLFTSPSVSFCVLFFQKTVCN